MTEIFYFIFCSEAKDQTNCDTNSTATATSNNNNGKQLGTGANINKTTMGKGGERPSIKFQLFAPTTKDVSINQRSRNCVNNNNFNNNNNNSVYNQTTSSLTSNSGERVLNGPSKLFRIPNLVKK